MFPEITRDEIFRIETRRLWLRWPMAADRSADCTWVVRKADDGAAQQASMLVAPDAVEQMLQRWSSENLAGRALNLLLTPKSGARQPIGSVRIWPGRDGGPLLEFGLHALWQGRTLMTEALEAFIDMVFRVTALPKIGALPRAVDPTGRLLLERLGFVLAETHAIEDPTSDRFCLDRETWGQQNAPRFQRPASPAPCPSLEIGCA